MNPKTIKISIKKMIVFFIDFLIDFSIVLRAFRASRTLIFAVPSMRKRVFLNAARLCFGSFLDVFRTRKWRQNHQQINKKTIKKSIQK
jgi:hypothetical protein